MPGITISSTELVARSKRPEIRRSLRPAERSRTERSAVWLRPSQCGACSVPGRWQENLARACCRSVAWRQGDHALEGPRPVAKQRACGIGNPVRHCIRCSRRGSRTGTPVRLLPKGMMIHSHWLLDTTPSPDRRTDQDRFTAVRPAPVPLRQLVRAILDAVQRAATLMAKRVSDGDRTTITASTCTAPRSRAVNSSRPAAPSSSASASPEGACGTRRRRPRRLGKNSLDATLASSWFEIHADNTILMRTGKVDFGRAPRTRRTSKSSPRS